jgi:hypothetical protein
VPGGVKQTSLFEIMVNSGSGDVGFPPLENGPTFNKAILKLLTTSDIVLGTIAKAKF